LHLISRRRSSAVASLERGRPLECRTPWKTADGESHPLHTIDSGRWLTRGSCGCHRARSAAGAKFRLEGNMEYLWLTRLRPRVAAAIPIAMISFAPLPAQRPVSGDGAATATDAHAIAHGTHPDWRNAGIFSQTANSIFQVQLSFAQAGPRRSSSGGSDETPSAVNPEFEWRFAGQYPSVLTASTSAGPTASLPIQRFELKVQKVNPIRATARFKSWSLSPCTLREAPNCPTGVFVHANDMASTIARSETM